MVFRTINESNKYDEVCSFVKTCAVFAQIGLFAFIAFYYLTPAR